MEDRQRKKAPISGKRCKGVMLSQSERELRKLESFVNYAVSSRRPKREAIRDGI